MWPGATRPSGERSECWAQAQGCGSHGVQRMTLPGFSFALDSRSMHTDGGWDAGIHKVPRSWLPVGHR